MDKREIIDIKGLPVYLQADVVVCGGGTAGVFAAVAAAKGVSLYCWWKHWEDLEAVQ